MEWPQILLVIIFTVKIVGGLFLNDKETKCSFWGNVFAVTIYSIILYYGGFWG